MNIHIDRAGKRNVKLTKREREALTLSERILQDLQRNAEGELGGMAGLAFGSIGNVLLALDGKPMRTETEDA